MKVHVHQPVSTYDHSKPAGEYYKLTEKKIGYMTKKIELVDSTDRGDTKPNKLDELENSCGTYPAIRTLKFLSSRSISMYSQYGNLTCSLGMILFADNVASEEAQEYAKQGWNISGLNLKLESLEDDKLYLYKIFPTKEAEAPISHFGRYRNAIVVARSAEEARKIHPSGNGLRLGYKPLEVHWPRQASEVTARVVGIADKSMVEGHVLMADFKWKSKQN